MRLPDRGRFGVRKLQDMDWTFEALVSIPLVDDLRWLRSTTNNHQQQHLKLYGSHHRVWMKVTFLDTISA